MLLASISSSGYITRREKMEHKTIQIATSPLTNTIYAGKILKPGVWANGKQDVTVDALVAVAEHTKKFGKPVEITDERGKLLHKIIVE